MLSTMARNASERAGSWTKESYRSSDSIESSEDSDNSSTNGSLNGDKNRTNNHNHNNNANNHSNHSTSSLPHLPPPIGCITTHRVSAVIRPEIKAPPIDPLQFVKIQKNELSKTAVEQIKLAEEEKITKEKIKEVEEEWQNNLMSWKSKRKLTKNHSEDETLPRNPNRKTKTFSEILNEKAKSGARIGYNLHKYIDPDLENVNVDDVDVDLNINYLSVVSQTTTTTTEEYLSQTTNDNSSEISNDHIDNNNQPNMELNNNNNNNNNNEHTRSDDDNVDHQQKQSKTNLDRFMETTNYNCMEMEKISRNGLGEIVVFNTSLLEEFSVKSDQQHQQQQHQHQCDKKINHTNDDEQQHKEKTQRQTTSPNIDINNDDNKKVHVPINDWKTSHPHSHHHHQSHDQLSPRNDDDTPYMQNSSFENDDDEDLDEELERLRIDQEKSFKAKLHTFEKLAKQEEEAAKRAAEANRKRQQNRIKLAAERSKSLSSINHSQTKNVLTASSSVSSSSLQNKNSNNNNNDNKSKHNNKPVNNNINKNNNNNEDQYYLTCKNPSTTSVVYNFKDKQEQNNINNNNNNNVVSNSNDQSQTTNITATNTKTMGQNSSHQQQQSSQISPAKKSQSLDESTINNNVEHKQQRDPVTSLNNIYENVTSIHQQQQQQQLSQPQLIQSNNIAGSTQQPILINQQNITVPSNEIIADPDAIRNASQKLLQQQQQIYQNQPPIQPVTTTSTSSPVNASIMHPSIVNNYPNDHYSNITSVHGNNGNFIPLHHHTISDDVGLPPVQITKSIQTPPISQHLSSDDLVNIQQQQQQQHPVYQNQFFHNRENINETMIMPVRDDLVSFHEPKKPFIHYPHPSPSPSPQLLYPSNQTHINSSCIYTPKPFTAGNVNAQVMQPIPMQQMPILNNVPQRIPATNRYGANGYNPNHWVIQEAELRQSTHRLQQQQQQQQPPQPSQQSQPIPPAPPLLPNKNGPGYLSVSGKKKCSKCGDELGKGCAAMVVESLSLYYHINCFRCSVCNVQLGNGTVGTDVRVRNNKLHCQNCYSNDEAGLKFSRV